MNVTAAEVIAVTGVGFLVYRAIVRQTPNRGRRQRNNNFVYLSLQPTLDRVSTTQNQGVVLSSSTMETVDAQEKESRFDQPRCFNNRRRHIPVVAIFDPVAVLASPVVSITLPAAVVPVKNSVVPSNKLEPMLPLRAVAICDVL